MTFEAKLRGIFCQKPSLVALGLRGLSSLNLQVSEGQLPSVVTVYPGPPSLSGVVMTIPCTAPAVNTTTALAWHLH